MIRESGFIPNRTGVESTAEYRMSELTQAVVDRGIVIAYWDLGSGANDWWQLPYTFQSPDVTVTFFYETGKVYLQVTGPTKASVENTVATINGYRLRVVVLPPA